MVRQEKEKGVKTMKNKIKETSFHAALKTEATSEGMK